MMQKIATTKQIQVCATNNKKGRVSNTNQRHSQTSTSVQSTSRLVPCPLDNLTKKPIGGKQPQGVADLNNRTCPCTG